MQTTNAPDLCVQNRASLLEYWSHANKKMNLQQPRASLREFYDFDAKFIGLDRDVIWPSIRLVVFKFRL
jgi:hypothetical protein